MALKFATSKSKKESEVEDEESSEEEPPFDTDEEEEKDSPKKSNLFNTKKKSNSVKGKSKSSKKKGGKASFLKTGKERKAALDAEAAKAKQRRSTRRFFIPRKALNEDYQITFLDGEFDDFDVLDGPVFFEHNIKIAGRWTQFVSCRDEEPDPLEEAGKEPYAAQAFTIIDHTPYEDSDGNVHEHQKKLFVAKDSTRKQLHKLASKRGGLKGTTWTVSRTGKMKPNVGDLWQYEDKNDIDDLKEMLVGAGIKKDEIQELVTPYEYEEVLVYHSADDIVNMGLVDEQSTISSRKAREEDEDLDDEL